MTTDAHRPHSPPPAVPGLEFLQDWLKNASAALPPVGPWLAPTLDPDALGRRIEELRTLHLWLEQNTRMIGTTIQALEVQRLTLTTLQAMNVPTSDLYQSMKQPEPSARAAPPAPGGADPLQWWQALTQQFAQLAAAAVKSSPADAAADGTAQPARRRSRATASPPPAARAGRKPRA